MKPACLAILCTVLWASSAFGQPYDIYVVDAGNFGQPPWQILKYDEEGKNPEVFISENLAWPHDMVFLEATNTVIVSNFNSGRIDRYNAETGQFIDIFSSNVVAPTRMKIGADNLLYVAQGSGSERIRRFRLDGTFVDDFTSLGLSRILGFDWDREGNLYVASYGGQLVRKFDQNGVDQGNFIQSNLTGPTNIWFHGNGDLLVSDYDAGGVRGFSPEGEYKGAFIAGLSQTEGVGFLPNGNILLGNGGTSSVPMFSPNGFFIEEIIAPGSGGLMQPNAVIVRQDPDWKFEINAGLNDAWYNPLTIGQGFLITVFPDQGQMFVAWFTFDTERPPEEVTANLGDSGHRWLTAQGPYDERVANLAISLTEGGVFDSSEPPVTTDPGSYGTMRIEFADCRRGLVHYDITSPDVSGVIPIERTALDNVALCEALSDP